MSVGVLTTQLPLLSVKLSAQGLLLAPFVACDILLDQQGGLTMEVTGLE